MSLQRKLKPDRNIVGPLIPVTMLLILGITSLIFGVKTGIVVTAVGAWIYCVFYLIVFARTRSLSQLFIFTYGLVAGLIIFISTNYVNATMAVRSEFRIAYFSFMIFFGFILIFLAINRKLKWRGREIFELAAESVDESGDGYTPRPRPVGKVDYNLQQLDEFARFTAKHLIAIPYFTSKNITLVPVKMGDEFGRFLGLLGDYRDATWINFDIDGEVSVHISQKDYLDYRDPLAFDQLCTSLGQVFIEFLELYCKGEGVRIVDRMDDLRIPIFS
jgi:hypothetical protein